MRKVHVYHDGKIGRAIQAVIVEDNEEIKLIEYIPIGSDQKHISSFDKKREDNGGVWSDEYNHWFYEERETVGFALLMEEQLMYDYWYEVYYPKLK